MLRRLIHSGLLPWQCTGHVEVTTKQGSSEELL